MNKKDWVLLGTVLSFGLFLRIYMLDANSLWSDEARPFLICNTESLESFFALLSQLNPHYPPLDLLIRRLAMKIFGGSVFVFLLPSVMFSLLGILIYFFIVKQICGKPIAFIHAILLTIHPLDIQYAQSGNNYAILNIFVPLSFYFLFRSLHEGKYQNWILYSIFLSLCFYSHLITMSVALSQLVLVIMTCLHMYMMEKNRKDILRVTFSYGLAGVLSLIIFSPWLYTLYLNGIDHGLSNWGRDLNITDIIRMFLGGRFSGLGYYHLPMVTFTIVGCIFLLKDRKNFFIGLAAVGLVSYAVSHSVTVENFFAIRYIFFLLPLFLIIPAVGIQHVMEIFGRYVNKATLNRLGTHTTFLLVGLTLVGLTVVNIPFVRVGYALHWHGSGNWKAVAEVINQRHKKDEFLIVPLWRAPVFSVYSDIPVYEIRFDHEDGQKDLISNETKLNRHTGKKWTYVYLRPQDREQAQLFINFLKSHNKPKGRIVLSTNKGSPDTEIMRTLGKYFEKNSGSMKIEHFHKLDLITVRLKSAAPRDGS